MYQRNWYSPNLNQLHQKKASNRKLAADHSAEEGGAGQGVALFLQGGVHVNVLLSVRVAQEEVQDAVLVAVDGGHQGALTAQLLKGGHRTGAPATLWRLNDRLTNSRRATRDSFATPLSHNVRATHRRASWEGVNQGRRTDEQVRVLHSGLGLHFE